MKNKNNTQLKFDGSVKNAYFSYLFSSFWRRPAGYVVSFVYLLFLSVILIIVPKVMHKDPLFIWNLSTFNIPLFTLLFISAACAATAVTIFRVSREDGTELSLSAKPLTKSTMVWYKALLYILISLVFTGLSIAIASLTLPVFGKFSYTNTSGIEFSKYKALLLSMLVGNLINAFLFSSISVFLSMVAGQVITMIVSLGIAFVMILCNFLFGQIAKKPADVLTDNYQAEIGTYKSYTKKQIEGSDTSTDAKMFTAIECYVTSGGQELHHNDTYKYWNKAEKESGFKAYAYLDFGYQLSSFYTSFGLEENKLEDVSKMPIGYNSAYNYVVDEDSHIINKQVLDDGNYPTGIYTWTSYQGKYYPSVKMLGSYNEGITSKWYLLCLAYNLDYDATSALSQSQWSYSYPNLGSGSSVNHLTYTLKDLILTTQQQEEAKTIFNQYLTNKYMGGEFFNNTLTTSSSGIWEGDYSSLDVNGKFLVNSKLLTYFFPLAQEEQQKSLKQYQMTKYGETHEFPYSTAEVVDAYNNDSTFRSLVYYLNVMASYGFNVGKVGSTTLYSIPITSSLAYCETYNNIYQFKINELFSFPVLAAIWGSLTLVLFSSAIIVYKKTDFK